MERNGQVESSSELAPPGSHQPLYHPPPGEAIPASTQAFQLQKDVFYLIQLMENINKPPVLNIPHPHGPQAHASSSSTQMPSLHSHLAWLQGCSTLWTPVHPKTKGSEQLCQPSSSALSLVGFMWHTMVPASFTCVLLLCCPAVPPWGLCSHHWDRQTSSDCWSRGRGQHVETREGQIRFVSLIKPGKDYGLFKPVSAAFQLPVR